MRSIPLCLRGGPFAIFIKILYLAIAISIGGIFQALHVPAGWLLGALVTGMVFGLYIKKLYFPSSLFKVSLAIIGANIGFMVIPEQFLTYHYLILPFFITILLTLTGGILLGKFMLKFSNVHPNTAFFCCLPGGASEVIALSKDYGADEQIVAAFHTTRITLFVLTIPLVVGLQSRVVPQVSGGSSLGQGLFALVCLLLIGLVALWIASKVPLPGISLLFAILFGFLAHQFVFTSLEIPKFATGVAQALMGAIVGIRFDRQTYKEFRRIGKVSLLTLFLYFLMSIGVATVFFLLTPLNFQASLLGVVPAGAAEMASTATALDIEPMMVATLQMLRVLILFALLPLLIKLFSKPVRSEAMMKGN